MACKANICGERYESDSSGKKVGQATAGGQVVHRDPPPVIPWAVWYIHCSINVAPILYLLWSAPQRPCPEWLYLLFIVDTKYTVEDIVGALLKQLKATKDTSISVKKPEDDNIRFTKEGNAVWI